MIMNATLVFIFNILLILSFFRLKKIVYPLFIYCGNVEIFK